MSQDKTKEELDFHTIRSEANRTYNEINSFNKDAISWHIWKNAFDRCWSFVSVRYEHQLTQAKGEIERLKEDNEQYAEEHEKSCNVTHNLHLLANDKRAEVIKLQSLLTQKDKEIAELKESENDFVLACNDYSDEVKELKKEIEALREGIESVIEKSAIQWINNDLTKLLNPSNEKGV